MKVSFDFDSTLSRSEIQGFVGELIFRGLDIYIITTRLDDVCSRQRFGASVSNDDLYDVADFLKISKDKIVFTNSDYKYNYILKDGGFLFHVDDDESEIEKINEFTKTKGILYTRRNKNWRQECIEILRSNNIFI